MAALAAQLPAGQHGLHPGDTLALLEWAVEEGEGQQHPRPGQGRAGLGDRQPIEGDAAEPLGQLEAARSAQLQAMAAATGGQAKPRGPIPQKTKAIAVVQVRQQLQRIRTR